MGAWAAEAADPYDDAMWRVEPCPQAAAALATLGETLRTWQLRDVSWVPFDTYLACFAQELAALAHRPPGGSAPPSSAPPSAPQGDMRQAGSTTALRTVDALGQTVDASTRAAWYSQARQLTGQRLCALWAY